MHLFRKEENLYKKKFTILGIKISLKKQRPAEMTLSKRIKALKLNFYNKVGYPLDIKNPETFNAKINWMKLFYRNNVMTRIVDKYEFKKYIAEQLGDGYTVPLLGVWDNVEDIDFSKLPERFVLKSNAQSDGKFIKIVKNKKELDIDALKSEMRNWLLPEKTLKKSFCWAYNNISLKILAEEYIENFNNDLYDYKLWCFNGEVKYIQFLSERNTKGLKMAFYDTEWKKQNFVYNYPLDEKTMPKPQNLDKMISIAEQLSKEFPYVRVDFYNINNKLYVGEMTFYSMGGYCKFTPKEWDTKLGELLDLPKVDIKYHPPFFEKVKHDNKRIIKILGKKVLTYHKYLSRKELTKQAYLLKQDLKTTNKELEATKKKLSKVVDETIKAEIKRTSNRFDEERLINQKMFNYLYQDNLTDEQKRTLLEERFYREVGYFPNIDNPTTFNEKINWLKLYYKNDNLSRCVDKYEFKNYIKEQLGEGYTIPLIGAWDNANDIDIESLPEKFVLKVNWSSYLNFIVKDKKTFNFDYAKSRINSWILPWRNIYFASFYYAYKNVTPKIIA